MFPLPPTHHSVRQMLFHIYLPSIISIHFIPSTTPFELIQLVTAPYLGIPGPRGKARAVRVEVDGVNGRFFLPTLQE